MTWVAGAVLTAAELNTYVPQSWTAYTPTLSGTGTTQGNSARSGSYMARGKVVDFAAVITLGGTTAIGSEITISLPVNAVSLDLHAGMYGKFTDSGSATYAAFPVLGALGTVTLYVLGTNGMAGATSSTAPFTWAAGDKIFVGGTYGIA